MKAHGVVIFFALFAASVQAELPIGWVVVEGQAVRVEGPLSHRLLLLDLHYAAASEWPTITTELGLSRPRPVTVVVVPTESARWPRASWIDSESPGWALGYAPLDTPYAAVFARRWPNATDFAPSLMVETLVHELAHVAIYQRGGATTPKWWQEGVAALISLRWRGWGGPYLAGTEVDSLAPIVAIKTQQQWWATHEDGAGALIYRAAADFVRWASEEYGGDVVRRVLARLAVEPFHAAWRAETGEGIATSEARWRVALHETAPSAPSVSSPSAAVD